jgi:two-component system response regulator FixJ
MPETPPIVYVVDDDADTRFFFSAVLSAAQKTCRALESAESFLLEYDPLQPGCLLLDVRMPGMSGPELQQKLNLCLAPIPLIFVTGHADISIVVAALAQGAFGFLQKPVAAPILLDQVCKALAHDHANRAARSQRQHLMQRFESLTSREQNVLSLLLQGRSNKAMASDMLLSQRTVELYRARVMEKTGSGSLAQLVRMAIELRVEPRPR